MKQYINYFFLIFLATTGLNAQNWTDTLFHEKNIVLEEFTGIYCGFCPYGHQLAHEVDSSNPGRVVLIGIHSSDTYSEPNTGSGHPDFRTEWGGGIGSMSGLTGFPSGMVNRTLFDTYTKKAVSRFDWDSLSNIILNSGDTADVNIGVRSLWNESTSTLSIDVELYYHKEQNIYNRLNIVLTESNIIGYQGGSLGGTNYEHNHVLREMISSDPSGTWNGIKVENIVPGEWQTFHFDYYLNTSNDTSIFYHSGYGHDDTVYREAININNCELAVFVTEFSNSNVLTGVKIHANNDSTTAPPPQNTHDKLPISKILKVYPNPSNGEVIFDLASNTKGEIIVWDLLGNIVFQKSINDRKTKVNTKGLNTGLYLYKLKTEKTSYSGKLMVR